MSTSLTLSDVLARRISVQWFEAVAVVRAAVEAILASSAETPSIPDLQHIHIFDNGTVAVRGGTSTPEPVRRLGQLLQATLGHSEPPVQLRLLISQATAPIPVYTSIRDFDQAIGYFERPDRIAVIQQLHARAAAAPVGVAADMAPTIDTIAPLPSGDPTKAARRANRKAAQSSTRRMAVAGIGFAAVCVITTSVAVKHSMSSTGNSGQVINRLSVAFDAAGDAFVNGLSFVTERIGLGRLVSADAPAPAPAPVPEPSAVRETAKPSRSQAATTTSTDAMKVQSKINAGDTRAHHDVRQRALTARKVPFAAFDLERNSIGTVSPVRPTETMYVPVASSNSQADGPIYSVESEGISAPVAVRPQLPRELPPDVKRTDLRQIDLVISRAGTVETVKLVGWPRNVKDSMLLSAVKAWEFVPALRDGQSVRYRKTIWIAQQP